jgi:hypothetical protein
MAPVEYWLNWKLFWFLIENWGNFSHSVKRNHISGRFDLTLPPKEHELLIRKLSVN